MTIATAGFQGVQRSAPTPTSGGAEAAADTAGLFEELLAALSVSIPIEEGAEAAPEETASTDLGKEKGTKHSHDEDSKPAWRTGFGWVQVSVPLEPAPAPVKLIPQGLGLSVQSTTPATSIESSTLTDTESATAAINPNSATTLSKPVESLDAQSAPKVEEGSASDLPKPEVAPPLAFELKIAAPADPRPATPIVDSTLKAAAISQTSTRVEMGSGMELSETKLKPKPVDEDEGLLGEKPEPAANAAGKGIEATGRSTESKHGKAKSDSGNSQSGGESFSHESDPASAIKTHSSSIVDSPVGQHHDRFSSELRQVEKAPGQSVTETASAAESKSSTPAQPVTSLRLHLESDTSAMPVDVTVKERAGQVRIEVRDANLGRNVELREQLPDLLKRLEEQGFHGEASNGIGREIAFNASSDANLGSNSDQQQQQPQDHGPNDRRQHSRSDGDEESSSQRNRQDRSKWQSAWFDMANSE